MSKRVICAVISCITAVLLIGCANTSTASQTETSLQQVEDNVPEQKTDFPLEDGIYMVNFDTDGSMFHVNEVMDGKAVLTVNDGEASVHLIMPSKNVLNLYKGLAENAKEDENGWISPSTEQVTYSDGMTEEVNAFDVPVDVLDEEFDLALIGKKEVWYDHKVSVSNPEKIQIQTVELSLEGGTGKVSLASPTQIKTVEDGYVITLIWSSKYYDYMIVDEEKYFPVETSESSTTFEIPVKSISEPLKVIADTVAMSTPHEIEYTITFLADTLK